MISNCRLTMDGQVDAGSPGSIVRDVLASLPAGASTQDKVLALFRWVREHLFAFVSTMDDAIEPLNKAMWTLNWWGFGLCGRQAKVVGILAANLLGAHNVRTIGITERAPGAWRIGEAGRPYAFVWSPQTKGWKPGGLAGHTSLEVRWDGQWHFFDTMVGFYRMDGGRRIVSLQEIMDHPALADQPVGDPLHGDMPYGPEGEIFTKSAVKFHEPGLNAWPGALPPLNLRPGESLKFLAEPLAGEFFIHPKMRAIFNDDVCATGPREARPHAPAARYGNAEHVYQVELRPEASDPFWVAETADWHVPVELPYPITSIHWEMKAVPCENASGGEKATGDCSGFLCFAPSTRDEIIPIPASGSHKPPAEALVGLGYRIVVRAPGRQGAVKLKLRTIVQHNPLVQPKLRAGRNVVRLAGKCGIRNSEFGIAEKTTGGNGKLLARIDYSLDGNRRTVNLQGAGEHEVLVPPGEISGQEITLLNAGDGHQ